jgi:hypothetical protein
VKIHVLKHVRGNFGDDLNKWLWHGLLGDVGSVADDEVLFVGIGTILDRNLPADRVTIVFGAAPQGYIEPLKPTPDCVIYRYYDIRRVFISRLS